MVIRDCHINPTMVDRLIVFASKVVNEPALPRMAARKVLLPAE